MSARGLHLARVIALLIASSFALPLRAEVSEVRVSKQYGLPYLTVVIVEQQRLIEKHAKLLGLGDVKVNWMTIGSGGTSTDSLLAGNLDFVTSGISNMLLLWSRTGEQAKAVGATGTVLLIAV